MTRHDMPGGEASAAKSLHSWLRPSVGDWPEDFPGENGNYQNRCSYCQKMFIGHKRRIVCKACFEESRRKFEAMSPEDQRALIEKQRAEVAEYLAKRRAED